jgi:crossover junction endodeoxyribonuclease RuvC
MIYAGCDPGLNGALAFFDIEKGNLSVIDMPTVEVKRGAKMKREVSPAGVANILRIAGRIDMLILERVNAMPGQGVSSVFSFGRSAGIIEGCVAALNIPMTIVPPQTWQKAVNLRGGKDGARQRAMELFPIHGALFARKKDDGRADAALMAWFAAMAK